MNVTRSGVNQTLTILPPAFTRNITVTVCKPAGVVFLTNTSAVYKQVILSTGNPYPFVVGIVDKSGALCRGDSQQDATELKVDLVTSGSIQQAVANLGMSVLNTNITGLATQQPVMNTVRAIGGAFTLQLWFTNSTLAIGVGQVRVRVQAFSVFPPVSSTVLSVSLDTRIAAQKLRFRPDTVLPRYWVTGRPMQTSAGAFTAVQAVDGLDPFWAVLGYVPQAPNVARRITELGNSVLVSWNVNPLPTTGFPMSFSVGLQSMSLSKGEAQFGFSWSGADGDYALSVATASSVGIQSTAPQRVYFQSIKQLKMESGCVSNCILSNVTNITTSTQMNITSLKPFFTSVFVMDNAGSVVQGDNASYVQVKLLNPSGSGVSLSVPPTFTARGEFFQRVTAGKAVFNLGFVGSTNISSVTLQFYCPAVINTTINGVWTSISNPCFGLNTVTSANLWVNDINVAPSVWSSPAVVSNSLTVKVPTRLPSLALFNVTDFQIQLALRLTTAFGYISTDNAQQVLQVVACEVDRNVFGEADLGNTVCGTSGICATTSTNKANCPQGVLSCNCPSSSSTAAHHLHLTQRGLLQTTSTSSPSVSVEVQVEVKVNLQNAVGFAATSSTAIAQAYSSVGSYLNTLLTTDATLSRVFAIDTSNVGTRNGNAPVVGATPAPPVVTAAPPTLAPIVAATNVSAPINAATTTHSMTLSVIVTMVLLALFCVQF